MVLGRSAGMELVAETPYRFRINRHGNMRVPGIVFASKRLLPDASVDHALEQVANVATLPGIVEAAYAMPDLHWGYGFPIGGVAATDVAAGGVELPVHRVMDGLDRAIPRGASRGAVWSLASQSELEQVLLGGSRYAVEQGHGGLRDLARC